MKPTATLLLVLSCMAVAQGPEQARDPEAQSIQRLLESIERRLDRNSDGLVRPDEFAAFFKRADRDKNAALVQEELHAALLGIHRAGPAAGELAPYVKATAADGGIVDLFRLRRPTVLVFGSWT